MTTKPKREYSPLIYADSELNADQLYFGKIFAPDRFISFQKDAVKYCVVGALEYTRFHKESAFDVILSLEEWRERARKAFRGRAVGTADTIRILSREFGIAGFLVSGDFPVGIALRLRAVRVPLKIAEGPLFPERERKSDEEARAIREGNAASAAGIRAAERILRQAEIRGNRLIYQGRSLTSERLRYAIDSACLERGAVASNTIVAGGDQACDPHCVGTGPLRPNQLIVIDVFPRVSKTGYYGDMTRTFLKGSASEAQHSLVATVRAAQSMVLKRLKAGVSGERIHREVEGCFESAGYRTLRCGQVNEGFFHGTGHGLGLEIHEPPRLSSGGSRLRSGMVTTVEPGLYYPGLGGCRIEDVVRINRTGVEMLSRCHYRWEIR